MIQDIFPHRYHNEYQPHPAAPEDPVLCYEGRSCLALRQENLAFPTVSDYCARTGSDPASLRYLFRIDNRSFYLGELPELSLFPEYALLPVNRFRDIDPQYLAFAGITGHQLWDWYRSRRFCGRCGHPMVHSQAERMMQCPDCGLMEYPKISPAVIIAVTHKNRLLLTKYAGREYTKYALIAGFTEIGETVEETVSREVMEEVGLPVKHIRYFKSQPWSFSSTVLMGFFCDLDGEDETIHLDDQELSVGEWFDREAIPVKLSRESLTNHMIQTFIRGEEPR